MKRRSRFVAEHLEKAKSNLLEMGSREISEFVRARYGVYALYSDQTLYYVGLASDLRRRMNRHVNDRHSGKWNRFSVYLTTSDRHMKELETLIVHIASPPGNRQSGRFVSSRNIRKELERVIKDRQERERTELFDQSPGGPRNRRRNRGKQRARLGHNQQGTEREPTLAGCINGPITIRATYKGKRYAARVRRDGRISFAGKLYTSPSRAGHAVRKHPTSGWEFWRYRDAKGDWVPLQRLRQE